MNNYIRRLVIEIRVDNRKNPQISMHDLLRKTKESGYDFVDEKHVRNYMEQQEWFDQYDGKIIKLIPLDTTGSKTSTLGPQKKVSAEKRLRTSAKVQAKQNLKGGL